MAVIGIIVCVLIYSVTFYGFGFLMGFKKADKIIGTALYETLQEIKNYIE